MTLKSYTEIDNIRNDMHQARRLHVPKWQSIAEFISPYRYRNGQEERNQGQRKDQKILKNEAGLALRTFVSGMMNGATSRARPWWRFTTLDTKLRNMPEVKRYFNECEEVINSYFEVSNLYRVLPSSYKDIGLFSNSAFAMLPDPKTGFYFYPFAVGTYSIGTDHKGQVNSFSRDFTLSVRQVVHKYGKIDESGKLDLTEMDPYITRMWKESRYEETVVLNNTILPNDRPKQNPLYARDKLYQSYTYIRSTQGNLPPQSPVGFAQRMGSIDGVGTGPDSGVFLSIRGYDYFPVIAPRWEVMAEDDYGVDGPGDLALGYVKGLQEKEKYRLEALAKLVKPPMIGPAQLRRHQASILAGGITYFDDSDRGTFRPAFQVDPRLNELVNSQMEDEQKIGACFFRDLFLMLAQDKPTSHVTARQIEEMSAEKLQAIAPVLGQLDDDQNGPLIQNAYIMLNQLGKLPPPPKSLEGQAIQPEYISVLAQAAKSSMMNSAERALNFTVSAAEALGDPSLIQLMDGEELVRRYSDWVGLDPNLIKTKKEFEVVRQAAQKAAAQQQQMMQQQQQAATAKDLSQAKVGEGSMLDNVMGQQQ